MRIKLSWRLRFSCSDETKEGWCFNRFSIRNFKNILRFVKHHFHVDARLKCPIFFFFFCFSIFFFWHIQVAERTWWRKTWKENRSPHPERETRTSAAGPGRDLAGPDLVPQAQLDQVQRSYRKPPSCVSTTCREMSRSSSVGARWAKVGPKSCQQSGFRVKHS